MKWYKHFTLGMTSWMDMKNFDKVYIIECYEKQSFRCTTYFDGYKELKKTLIALSVPVVFKGSKANE